jgi:hypothetical protein
MLKLLLPFFALLLLQPLSLCAQHTVTGVVRSASGEPVAGATIRSVASPAKATGSDIEGRFSLETSPFDTLSVSFVGYESRQTPVNNRTSLK